MKNEFYVSKTKRTIIKISSITHCGLIHHSILDKNITKEDLLSGDNVNNPDCIFFNMNNNNSVVMYFNTSKEAKVEFNKLLKLIQENDI